MIPGHIFDRQLDGQWWKAAASANIPLHASDTRSFYAVCLIHSSCRVSYLRIRHGRTNEDKILLSFFAELPIGFAYNQICGRQLRRRIAGKRSCSPLD
jgi:hypothetical protein